MQAFVGYVRVVTSLGQAWDIETQSCPPHLTIDSPWGPVGLAILFILLPWGGDVVIIGEMPLIKKLGIDVMAQLKASVLKAQGRHDGAGMELAARSVGEPTHGAVLQAAKTVTAFVPAGDAPGDVDDEVKLTLPSQRPMISQESQIEMRDRAGVLETAVDNDVSRCCAISLLARTLACNVSHVG